MKLKKPKTIEEWKYMFPDLTAQKEIERLIKAVVKTEEFYYAQSENDTEGFSDRIAWLSDTSSLLLNESNKIVLKDLRPLKPFENITHLSIAVGMKADLSGLKGLRKLYELNIEGGQNSDWSFLSELTKLNTLNIDTKNKPARIPSLGHLKELKNIRLSGNYDSISFLEGSTSLEIIELQNNSISDLSPLKNMISLIHLDIDNNRVSDISPLSKLTSLDRFYCKGNLISDFSPIYSLSTSINYKDAKFRTNQLTCDGFDIERLVKNWDDLNIWKELSVFLTAQSNPLGKKIAHKLSGKPSDLPCNWARAKKYELVDLGDKWGYKNINPIINI